MLPQPSPQPMTMSALMDRIKQTYKSSRKGYAMNDSKANGSSNVYNGGHNGTYNNSNNSTQHIPNTLKHSNSNAIIKVSSPYGHTRHTHTAMGHQHKCIGCLNNLNGLNNHKHFNSTSNSLHNHGSHSAHHYHRGWIGEGGVQVVASIYSQSDGVGTNGKAVNLNQGVIRKKKDKYVSKLTKKSMNAQSFDRVREPVDHKVDDINDKFEAFLKEKHLYILQKSKGNSNEEARLRQAMRIVHRYIKEHPNHAKAQFNMMLSRDVKDILLRRLCLQVYRQMVGEMRMDQTMSGKELSLDIGRDSSKKRTHTMLPSMRSKLTGPSFKSSHSQISSMMTFKDLLGLLDSKSTKSLLQPIVCRSGQQFRNTVTDIMEMARRNIQSEEMLRHFYFTLIVKLLDCIDMCSPVIDEDEKRKYLNDMLAKNRDGVLSDDSDSQNGDNSNSLRRANKHKRAKNQKTSFIEEEEKSISKSFTKSEIVQAVSKSVVTPTRTNSNVPSNKQFKEVKNIVKTVERKSTEQVEVEPQRKILGRRKDNDRGTDSLDENSSEGQEVPLTIRGELSKMDATASIKSESPDRRDTSRQSSQEIEANDEMQKLNQLKRTLIGKQSLLELTKFKLEESDMPALATAIAVPTDSLLTVKRKMRVLNTILEQPQDLDQQPADSVINQVRAYADLVDNSLGLPRSKLRTKAVLNTISDDDLVSSAMELFRSKFLIYYDLQQQLQFEQQGVFLSHFYSQYTQSSTVRPKKQRVCRQERKSLFTKIIARIELEGEEDNSLLQVSMDDDDF